MFKVKEKHEDIIGDLFGGGSDAGSRGAAVEQQFNQQAIDEMRRQFGITQDNISPNITAGHGQIPSLIQGTTAGGLNERLAQIFNTDTFGSLVEERGRAVQGQLAAGGLTRSGTALQEAARVPTDIGLMLEQMLTGRSAGLVNTGVNAATNLGNIGAANSSGIADLLNKSGVAGSSGIITDAQTDAAGSQNLLNTAASVFTNASSAGGIGSLISGFFSDPKLKDNIEEIGAINDLKLYQWDWKPVFKDTIVNDCPTVGFLSTEVRKKYPQFVGEFGGFDMLDYHELLNELEMKEAA
jgi:hypothetical protein